MLRSILGILAATLAAAPLHAEVSDAIASVRAVGHDGAGHVMAQAAVRELEAGDASVLVPILTGMDGANPLAANWLRGAFETAAARLAKQPAGLPVDDLLRFFSDRNHEPTARRLAYEWIIRAEPQRADELIPQALDDPSIEMRRDAVARLLESARSEEKEGHQQEAAELYRQALSGAGDPEQVNPIVKSLSTLGETVNLVDHYGLLPDWMIIGPFDNTDQKGFAVDYPPEHGVDLQAKYSGKLGEVRWSPLAATSKDGTFDIAELTDKHKGACDYLTRDFEVDHEQPVEFRLATANAWKLWLNGELLFAREEYHRGMHFDQYRIPAVMKAGKNTILLKICQNEMDQEWAQQWRFQFRICDPYGRALHAGGSSQ